jgi:protein TonB
MAHPRLEASSIRNQYTTHLQAGLALSLVLLLGVVHLSPPLDREVEPTIRGQETADLRLVQSTRQAQASPAPPTPIPPQVLPRERIVKSPSVEFDTSLGLNGTVDPSDEVIKRPDCGGLQSLRSKTHYPPSALMEGLEGRVLVEFVVDENGDTETPKVADGSHEVLNQAALRAVRRLECMPGRKQSRPVRAKMTQMVVFELPKRMVEPMS